MIFLLPAMRILSVFIPVLSSLQFSKTISALYIVSIRGVLSVPSGFNVEGRGGGGVLSKSAKLYNLILYL